MSTHHTLSRLLMNKITEITWGLCSNQLARRVLEVKSNKQMWTYKGRNSQKWKNKQPLKKSTCLMRGLTECRIPILIYTINVRMTKQCNQCLHLPFSRSSSKIGRVSWALCSDTAMLCSDWTYILSATGCLIVRRPGLFDVDCEPVRCSASLCKCTWGILPGYGIDSVSKFL